MINTKKSAVPSKHVIKKPVEVLVEQGLGELLSPAWKSHLEEVKKQALQMVMGSPLVLQHPEPMEHVEALKKGLSYVDLYLKAQGLSEKESFAVKRFVYTKSCLGFLSSFLKIEEELVGLIGQYHKEGKTKGEVRPLDSYRNVQTIKDAILGRTEALALQDRKIGTNAFGALVSSFLKEQDPQSVMDILKLESFVKTVEERHQLSVQRIVDKKRQWEKVFEGILQQLDPCVDKGQLLMELAYKAREYESIRKVVCGVYYKNMTRKEQENILEVVAQELSQMRKSKPSGWGKIKDLLDFLEGDIHVDKSLYLVPLRAVGDRSFIEYLEQGLRHLWDRGSEEKLVMKNYLQPISNQTPLLKMLEVYGGLLRKLNESGIVLEKGVQERASAYASLSSILSDFEKIISSSGKLEERVKKKKEALPVNVPIKESLSKSLKSLPAGLGGVLENYLLYFVCNEQRKLVGSHPKDALFFDWFDANCELFSNKVGLMASIVASSVKEGYSVSATKDNQRLGKMLKVLMHHVNEQEVLRFFEMKHTVDFAKEKQSLFSICVEKGILARVFPTDAKVAHLTDALQQSLTLLGKSSEGRALFEQNYNLLFEKKRSHVSFASWSSWGQSYLLRFSLEGTVGFGGEKEGSLRPRARL